MEKVLKNCKPFVEVLAMAHSGKVQHWTQEHFQRAVTWCVYFEKAYEMMRKLPGRSNTINRQLQLEVSRLSAPWPGNAPMDFAYLQFGLCRLCEALLRNPHTPLALLAATVDKAFTSKDVLYWATVVSGLLKDNDVLLRLDPHLKSIASSRTGTGPSGMLEKPEAAMMHLLACQLSHSLAPGTEDKFIGFNPEQDDLLYQLIKVDIGLETILTAAISSSSSNSRVPKAGSDFESHLADGEGASVPSRLACELVDWVLTCSITASSHPGKVSSACRHHVSLFHVRPDLLASVAQAFDMFLDCYLQHLLHWTQSYVCIDLCDCSAIGMQGGSYHWHFAQSLCAPPPSERVICCCTSELQEWQALVACYRSLAQHMGATREKTLRALQSHAYTARDVSTPTLAQVSWKVDFRNNVWEDILEKIALPG